MARNLLSGAPIVYHGNPLNDLSLAAVLDKFMEKKPKQSTWHGGSHIEPARKLDIDSHLIGREMLSLAESDVRPEDVVFHKFYMNKMSSSKKPKKKKKNQAADEEAAELYGGSDESDEEEIDQMLDSGDLSIDADGDDYDYDDLDRVVNEDDDDLVDRSDGEMDGIPVVPWEEEEGDDGGINVGVADDALGGKKRKRKTRGQVGASPFASLEEYEHLINDEDPVKGKNKRKKQSRAKQGKWPSEDN